MEQIILKHKIVAILRKTPQEDLTDYVDSLYAGGLRCFEVSFSAPGAADQLAFVRKHLPADACVGAGTILNTDQAKQAADAGADFQLAPSTNPEVIAWCRSRGIPFMPGVFSPTDVSVALACGCRILKLFPVDSVPVHYAKSMKGPFPEAQFVAVGGVTPKNTADYLKAGYAGVGFGSSLADKTLFAQKNWRQISADISVFLNSLKEENLL